MPVAGALALTGILVLTGCSQGSQKDGISDKAQEALTSWQNSLDESLADPTRGSSTAAGFTQGGGAIEAPAGRSDLLVACDGALKLKFEASSTKTGDSVGSVTAICGIADRIELNMARTKDLSFTVEQVEGGTLVEASKQPTVFWYVSVVRPGFPMTHS